MKKFAVLYLVYFSVFCFAQINKGFPLNQEYFPGNWRGLQNTMVNVVKDNNIQPCENKDEIYILPIIINEDATINYVADFDSLNIAKNKCAYDFGRKILPFLKGWKAGIINGKLKKCLVEIEINPFYIYYSKRNSDDNVTTYPTMSTKDFSNWAEAVKFILDRNLDTNLDQKGSLSFTVKEDGSLADVEIQFPFLDEKNKKLIESKITKLKNRWTPKMFNGIPVSYKRRFDLSQVLNKNMEPNQKRDAYKHYDSYQNPNFNTNNPF